MSVTIAVGEPYVSIEGPDPEGVIVYAKLVKVSKFKSVRERYEDAPRVFYEEDLNQITLSDDLYKYIVTNCKLDDFLESNSFKKAVYPSTLNKIETRKRQFIIDKYGEESDLIYKRNIPFEDIKDKDMQTIQILNWIIYWGRHFLDGNYDDPIIVVS